MNRLIFLVSLFLFFAFVTIPSYADTVVDVSGDGDSQVQINTRTSTSSNAVSTSDSHTNIRMETNGKVQEYHSDSPVDVHMQSEDGKTTVDTTTDSAKNIKRIPSYFLHISRTPVLITPIQIKQEMQKIKLQKKRHENFLQKMRALLEGFIFPSGSFFRQK